MEHNLLKGFKNLDLDIKEVTNTLLKKYYALIQYKVDKTYKPELQIDLGSYDNQIIENIKKTLLEEGLALWIMDQIDIK